MFTGGVVLYSFRSYGKGEGAWVFPGMSGSVVRFLFVALSRVVEQRFGCIFVISRFLCIILRGLRLL